MDKDLNPMEIERQLDALYIEINARRDASFGRGKINPSLVLSLHPQFLMTDDEVQKVHDLKMMLPNQAQLRYEAKTRNETRINARNKKIIDTKNK